MVEFYYNSVDFCQNYYSPNAIKFANYICLIFM